MDLANHISTRGDKGFPRHYMQIQQNSITQESIKISN